MTEPQIFGTHEPKTLDQLRDVASRAERAALMADGHLGYVMPIGGGGAYRGLVGVGGDATAGHEVARVAVGHERGALGAAGDIAQLLERVGLVRSENLNVSHWLFP